MHLRGGRRWRCAAADYELCDRPRIIEHDIDDGAGWNAIKVGDRHPRFGARAVDVDLQMREGIAQILDQTNLRSIARDEVGYLERVTLTWVVTARIAPIKVGD